MRTVTKAILTATLVVGLPGVATLAIGSIAVGTSSGPPATETTRTPAWAPPSPPASDLPSAAEIDAGLSEAEREDLQFLAESSGDDYDDVMGDYHGSMEFESAADAIRTAFPDEYAEASWRTPEGVGPWISFRGDVPRNAMSMVADVPVAVELRGGAGLNDRERGEVTVAVMDEFGQVCNGADSTAWMLPGELVVEISSACIPDDAAMERLRAVAVAATPPGSADVTVEFVEAPEFSTGW